MNKNDTDIDTAALEVLRSTGINILEAAILAKDALDAGRGKVRRARKCLAAGADALRQQERTVTFEKAVEAALEARRDRRVRTVYDFRYFTRRFVKRCKGLAARRVRSITPQECAGYIEQAFDTPRQRQKARLILSGVFDTTLKRGWCNANPVARVEAPRVVEQQVPILTPQEIEQITTTAETYRDGSCAAGDDSQAAAQNSLGAQAGGWGNDLPGELAAPLAGTAPRSGVGLLCPPLAAGCTAAYLCELSFKPLPQFCRAAAGDRTPGCYAAAYAVCGPTARCECGSILGRLNLADRRNSLCAAEILSTAGGNSLATRLRNSLYFRRK